MKRLLCFLLTVTMLFSMLSVCAFADTTPTVTAGNVSVQQGNAVTVSVTVQNFATVGAADISLYYDQTALSVTGTTVGNLIDGSNNILSVNTDTAGQIRMTTSAVSGFSDSGTLLKITFKAAADAPAGAYALELTVGDAFGVDLTTITVGKVNGSVTVQKKNATVDTFYLSSSRSPSTAKKDDVITFRLNNNYNRSFAAAEFVISYDDTLLAVESVELSSGMLTETAQYSVNTAIPGTVRVTYASADATNTNQLLFVYFKVIADVDKSARIDYAVANVYNADQEPYAPYSSYTSITIQKKPEVVDYPDLWLETERMVVGQQVKSVLKLEKGANVAAGDFVVTYDPTLLRCVNVSAGSELTNIGGVVMVDDNFTDGTIEFPYINAEGYGEEDIVLVEILWEPLRSNAGHTIAVPSGAMVYDVNFQPKTLEYVTASECIFVRTVIAPVCLEDGRTNYTCACGKSIDEDIVPKLGHDIHNTAAKEPDCTQLGWYDYESCSRCDYTTYEELPALGHDEVSHEAQVQTCLGIGWETYVTCNRCDYTTYHELPALGHRTVISAPVLTDPLSLEFVGDTPFTLENGAYYSNNHTNSSVSELYITALYDCQLTITGNVSSESGCDKLIVLKNNQQLLNISGEVTGRQLEIALNAGDKITVCYQKDGSASNGKDRCWVELQYEFVMAGGYADAPSETLEPDCVNAVVCSYCGTVVKDIISHDYQSVFQWNENHTDCQVLLVCRRDCGTQATVTCSVEEDVSDPAKTVHVATAEHEGQTFTETLSCDNHLVVFQNWDGQEVSRGYFHLGRAVDVPTAPTKEADDTYTYAFTGWNPQVTECRGDAVYTAVFEPAYIDYTVTFKNWDGTVLQEKTYHYGDVVTAPADPTKAADNTYTYTFTGWDQKVTSCAGNTVYTAVFEAAYIDYTVTFKDWDGTILQQKTYHYDDKVTAPAAPARAADNTYTYVFAGWDREITDCTGEMTYTAVYTSTYIDYTVIFKNWDGTVISQSVYHYGDTVVIPDVPEKPSGVESTYVFVGWDKTVVPCAGDTVYTAVFSSVAIDYTVTFKDWDGTVLQKKIYHYGDVVTAPAAPTKAADNTYTYTFIGWDKEVTICTGSVEYTAVFEAAYIDYTVTFKDWNGTVLQEKTYHYGDVVTAPAAPTKAADNTYTYAFTGWDKEVTACAGNVVYTAVYEQRYIDYTVIFKDWDGAVLQEKTYHYGDKVTAPAAPTKAADNTYTYTFTGWGREVTACAGNAVYTAVFEAKYIDYTVTFKNWDGTVLQEQTYHYGDAVAAPATPAKAADNTYTYTFTGWDKKLTNCAGNAVYTAVFEAVYIEYTVVFKNADGSVLQEKTYHYGDAVVAPGEPTPPEGTDPTWVFKGWDAEISESCAGNAVYTAVFAQPYPRGDMNCDMQVTDADAVYLLRHTLFAEEYPIYQSGDFNGDGRTTDADAVYLLRHTLFPDEYPLN